MRKYARYSGYKKDEEYILWLWDIIESWTDEMRSKFVFFMTGSFMHNIC